MKKLIILTFIVLLSSFCRAQFVGSQIKLYAGKSQGSFMGVDMINEGNFSAPSLFKYYKGFSGQNFKGLVKINPLISIGIGADMIKASNWVNPNASDYDGSALKQNSISTVIQFHKFFNKFNFCNGVNLFLEIAPVLGQTQINLKKSIWSIKSQNGTEAYPLQSKDAYYGIKGSAGLEWSFNQFVGLFASYSFQENKISSDFYNDKQFLRSQLDFGLFMKVIKDKRFYR